MVMLIMLLSLKNVLLSLGFIFEVFNMLMHNAYYGPLCESMVLNNLDVF